MLYKSKSVQVKSIDGGEEYSPVSVLMWILSLIGALLYAYPYSSQSPALESCYLTHLNVAASPEARATLSQASNAKPAQQQDDSGRQGNPAQANPSLCDQQSSSASYNPYPPGGAHLLGGPHSHELGTVLHSRQNNSPRSEACTSGNPKQPQ